MSEDDIQIGHCYRRRDGGIRFVEKIEMTSWGEVQVSAKSRLVTDPFGEWPGVAWAAISIFAALSEYECIETGERIGA